MVRKDKRRGWIGSILGSKRGAARKTKRRAEKTKEK
jgi:hypothetical protein